MFGFLAKQENRMAKIDYMLCSVCDNKTFYDAYVDYSGAVECGRLCDMAAICQDCAKTHSIKIVEEPTADLVSEWLRLFDEKMLLGTMRKEVKP